MLGTVGATVRAALWGKPYAGRACSGRVPVGPYTAFLPVAASLSRMHRLVHRPRPNQFVTANQPPLAGTLEPAGVSRPHGKALPKPPSTVSRIAASYLVSRDTGRHTMCGVSAGYSATNLHVKPLAGEMAVPSSCWRRASSEHTAKLYPASASPSFAISVRFGVPSTLRTLAGGTLNVPPLDYALNHVV